MAGADLTPGTTLFVAAFVAGLFLFAAALTHVAAGGVAAVRGLVFVFAGLGAAFLLAGLAGAAVVALLGEQG